MKNAWIVALLLVCCAPSPQEGARKVPNTFNNEVLAHDGMGITHGDFNDAQRYTRSMMLNNLIAPMLQIDKTSTTPWPWNYFVFAIDPQAGAVGPGTGALTVTNKCGGVIATVPGDPIGTDASVMVYRLDPGELVYTLDPGDATFGRYDMLMVKLDVIEDDTQTRDFEDATTRVLTSQPFPVKRRVRLQKQIVKGTPAASPFVPNMLYGWMQLATVYVAPGKTTAFAQNTLEIFDVRIPVGLHERWLFPKDVWHDGNWTYSQGTQTLTSTTATAAIYAPLMTGRHSRLIDYEESVANLLGGVRTFDSWRIIAGGSAGTNPLGPAQPGVASSGIYMAQNAQLAVWSNGHANPLGENTGQSITLGGGDSSSGVFVMTLRATVINQTFKGIKFIYAGG